MLDFVAVAQRLGALYQARKGANIELAHQEEDARNRQLALVPAGGREGKNEEARKQARDLVFANDAPLKAINAQIGTIRENLADIEAEIEALEELRDGMRWTVRQATAESMRGALLFRDGEQLPEDVAEVRFEEEIFDDDDISAIEMQKESLGEENLPF